MYLTHITLKDADNKNTIISVIDEFKTEDEIKQLISESAYSDFKVIFVDYIKIHKTFSSWEVLKIHPL